jgi:hypothetical protein
MPLKQLAVDDSPHYRDGLVLHGYKGSSEVTAFISRLVIDDWIDPMQGDQKRRKLALRRGRGAEVYDAPSSGTVVSCSILASCSLPLTVVSLPSLE